MTETEQPQKRKKKHAKKNKKKKKHEGAKRDAMRRGGRGCDCVKVKNGRRPSATY